MVQLEWAEEAEEDLDDILSYLSKSSSQYANLRDRELFIQKYRLIYRFLEEDDKILIMMIIHGSRLLKL